MNKMTFDAMRRCAEEAEIAAVLKTISAPATLELEPIDHKPYALPGRVILNASAVLP